MINLSTLFYVENPILGQNFDMTYYNYRDLLETMMTYLGTDIFVSEFKDIWIKYKEEEMINIDGKDWNNIKYIKLDYDEFSEFFNTDDELLLDLLMNIITVPSERLNIYECIIHH